MRSRLHTVSSALLAAGLVLAPVGAVAQGAAPSAPSGIRASLEAQARTLEQSATSSAYGERTRERARRELELVRRRLAEGDFFGGEQIRVRMDGSVPMADTTLTVLDSAVVLFPNVGRVSLRGVLREELVPVLERAARAVIRDATISAWPLTRLAVTGQVTRPGYFAVSGEMTLDQLLTLAGGPLADGAIEKLRLVRGDDVIFQGAAAQSLIANGRTVRSIALQDGDAVFVPRRAAPWDRAATLQILTVIAAPLITILLVQ